LEVAARGKAIGRPREKREQKKSGPMKDRKVILRNAQIVFRARLQRTPEHTFVLDAYRTTQRLRYGCHR
jgi:hypothetical protein